jgi:DNA-binding CsgD family transcriptional regulator
MAPGGMLPAAADVQAGGGMRLSFVGVPAPGELLLRVAPHAPRPEMLLRDRLDLTLREAEVLLWISYGKATRDIADILRLSPRTVDKHLEQIYNKLGLANRASAASLATRLLGEVVHA